MGYVNHLNQRSNVLIYSSLLQVPWIQILSISVNIAFFVARRQKSWVSQNSYSKICLVCGNSIITLSKFQWPSKKLLQYELNVKNLFLFSPKQVMIEDKSTHKKCTILLNFSVIMQLTWYKVHTNSIPMGKLITHTVIALLAKKDGGLSTISTNYQGSISICNRRIMILKRLKIHTLIQTFIKFLILHRYYSRCRG